MKILLTGFEAFLDVQVNISQVVLDAIEIPGVQVHKILLPVSYDRSFKELQKYTLEINPDFIIMMGIARSRTLVSLEKNGTNKIHSELKDNDNVIPHQEAEDRTLATTIDVGKIINLISLKYRSFVEESLSAGTYVCNSLYYHCLNSLSKKSLFIHLPPPSENLNEKELTNIVTEVIQCLKLEV